MLPCAHRHENETSGSMRVRVDCEGQEVSGFCWKEKWRRIMRVEGNVERMQEDIMPSADLESAVIPKRTPLIQCSQLSHRAGT